MSKQSQLRFPQPCKHTQLKSIISFTSKAEANILDHYCKETTPHLSMILDVWAWCDSMAVWELPLRAYEERLQEQREERTAHLALCHHRKETLSRLAELRHRRWLVLLSLSLEGDSLSCPSLSPSCTRPRSSVLPLSSFLSAPRPSPHSHAKRADLICYKTYNHEW